MGKRHKREYKKISNDEFTAAWNKPENKRQIEFATRPFKYSLDNHIISSLQHEALWLAISNWNPEKSNFKTYLYLTTRYLLCQHCSAKASKSKGISTVNIIDEEKQCYNRPSKESNSSNELDLYIAMEEIMIVLQQEKYSERDRSIFFEYLEGFKTAELGEKYGCSGKNISRIIISCKESLEKNANRTELPLSGSQKSRYPKSSLRGNRI